MSIATEREFDAQCFACGWRWYLRLKRIADYSELVRCPRCGDAGVAHRMLADPFAENVGLPESGS